MSSYPSVCYKSEFYSCTKMAKPRITIWKQQCHMIAQGLYTVYQKKKQYT